MPNKDRNKRSVRQARQRERAEHEAQLAEASASSDGKKKAIKPQASKKAAPSVKAGETGFFGRIRNHLRAVRAEMRRVTWPSKTELTNYSVAVVAMLIFFGVAVWAVDTGFVALLVAYTGLRG